MIIQFYFVSDILVEQMLFWREFLIRCAQVNKRANEVNVVRDLASHFWHTTHTVHCTLSAFLLFKYTYIHPMNSSNRTEWNGISDASSHEYTNTDNHIVSETTEQRTAIHTVVLPIQHLFCSKRYMHSCGWNICYFHSPLSHGDTATNKYSEMLCPSALLTNSFSFRMRYFLFHASPHYHIFVLLRIFTLNSPLTPKPDF